MHFWETGNKTYDFGKGQESHSGGGVLDRDETDSKCHETIYFTQTFVGVNSSKFRKSS